MYVPGTRTGRQAWMDNGERQSNLRGFVSKCVIFPESFTHIQLSFQKNNNSFFSPSSCTGRGHEWNSLITITNSTSIPEVWEQTLQMLWKQLNWGRSWTCRTEQGFSNHSSELLVNHWKTNAASCHQHFQKIKYWIEIMSKHPTHCQVLFQEDFVSVTHRYVCWGGGRVSPESLAPQTWCSLWEKIPTPKYTHTHTHTHVLCLVNSFCRSQL